MKIIGITAKRTRVERYASVFRRVYNYLKKSGKEIYIEKHVAQLIGLKKYNEFHRGRTQVDMILVMGGDGTILSVVEKMRKFNTKIFGINTGTLGFMSEISPTQINQTLKRIFAGEFTLDERFMLQVEVKRGNKVVKKLHALNEAVIAQGTLARMIKLGAKVDNRKLTTYRADGLIVATPTGSTAYNLSAGGPILYPSIGGVILTPICPHSFTQKPIIIPESKKIEIEVKSNKRLIHLTVDGQRNYPLIYKDKVKIVRGDVVKFVRLPTESFFSTLREKLDWGEDK